jgi:hypothetical protein
VSRPWYLLITVSAPILTVTVASLVLYDIIWMYRQRAQAEWLLHRARDYFSENGSQQRSSIDEMTALHDMVVCHEISMHYRKAVRKKSNSPALSDQNTLT